MNNYDPSLPEPLRSALDELRKDYLARWPEKHEGLESLLAQLSGTRGSGDALTNLRMEFHKLSGSGGSYGMPEITAAGREAETYVTSIIDAGGAVSQDAHRKIQEYLARLNDIFSGARRESDLEE